VVELEGARSLLESKTAKPAGRFRVSPRSGSLILLSSATTDPAKKVRRKPSLEEALGLVTGLLENLRPHTGKATLLTVPLLHGHGLATLVLSLALGSPLFLFPKAGPDEFLRCVEERKIKVLVLVPTILYRLLEAAHPHHDLSSLRAIFCGSAPLDAGLATRALERFGDVLYNLYGSSETGVISLATPEDLRRAPATVGKVLLGVDLRIQGERQSAIPAGEPGHIFIVRGRAAISTGDVGYLDAEGRLFLLGRADDLLICGGENVFPEAIESRVNQALEYVLESAVMGIPDPEYGQALHLFVVLKTGHAGITPEAIARDLEPLFPRTLRPKKITVLSELPKNLAGKVLRYKLQDPG
jgi:acyl-CoA synthetase (AMP-forming)/AMP-acid ligase II